ncbi:glycosyltransferase [Bacteroidales bacterium]|nr:glycosyltransferase [Bacteroidales bacterium]
MVDYLSDEAKFYIITSNKDYLETSSYPDIASNTWIDYNGNTKVMYIDDSENHKLLFENQVRQIQPNSIYINGVYSPKYSILPLKVAQSLKHQNIIVSTRGMLSSHAFSSKSLKKKLFLKVAILLGWYKKVTFHVTNHDEKNAVQQFFPKNKIVVLENFPRKVTSTENPSSKFKNQQSSLINNKLSIVSVARISIEKNTKFVFEVLSLLAEKVVTERTLEDTERSRSVSTSSRNASLDITLDIYGSIYNPAYWNQCLEIAKLLPDTIRVNYKGEIHPDKVIETFAQYDIAFMPSLGENFGHSILESFIAGTPVITSTNTPWRNLMSSDVSYTSHLTSHISFSNKLSFINNQSVGADLSLDDPQKFVDVLNDFLSLTSEQKFQLSENAFQYAKKVTDNKALVSGYLKMFEEK